MPPEHANSYSACGTRNSDIIIATKPERLDEANESVDGYNQRPHNSDATIRSNLWEQFSRLSNATEDFKLAGAGTPLNERFISAVFKTTTESMEAPNGSEMGTVKIMLAGIEMTTVLDASVTENAISFKTLYELTPFPNFQHFENNLVWTESGPLIIVAEFCPKVLVDHQEVGYVNFLVSHDIGHLAILGSKFMKENNLMGAAHIKPERVEDYCKGSETMKNVEHFQRMEKVGVLTTVFFRGNVGIYRNMSPHEEKISSDPAKASTASIFQVLKVS